MSNQEQIDAANARKAAADQQAAQYNSEAVAQRAAAQAATADGQLILNKLNTLETSVNSRIAAQKTETTRVENQLTALKKETDERLMTQRADMERRAKQVLDTCTLQITAATMWAQKELDALNSRIDKVRDPISGRRVPLNEALQALFELHRDNALTAQAYDDLELPAGVYDDIGLTAYEYDYEGKEKLARFDGTLEPLTAQEYDALELTAVAFDEYALTAMQYELYGKAMLV